MIKKKSQIDKHDLLAEELRKKSIIGVDKFLITNFRGSLQEKDFTKKPNCSNFGRIHHFKYDCGKDWVNNPLPEEVAAWKLGLPIEGLEKVQIFQNAACNWRCWYCYVDYDCLLASNDRAEFKTADDLIDLFLKEKDRPLTIDMSGGQPDIIPEWPIRMMEALIKRNLEKEYFLWLDDNLSLDFAWKYLTKSDFLLMKTYRNFGRIGCFKGFSPASFHENTNAPSELFKQQINIMSKWVKLGLDMYGYITLTSSKIEGVKTEIRSFMDAVQKEIHPNFLLRIVPLKIGIDFSPTKTRMTASHKKAYENQFEVLSIWKDELQTRYSKNELEQKIYLNKLE